MSTLRGLQNRILDGSTPGWNPPPAPEVNIYVSPDPGNQDLDLND